jgi:hypothetical protein
MKGFFLGLFVAGLAFAGYYVWKQRTQPARPAAAAGEGAAPGKEAHDKKKRHRRGAQRLAREDGAGSPAAGPAHAPRPAPKLSEPEPEQEPVKLSPADLKIVSQGDDLSRPDVIHMGDATDDSGTHELSQDEIDARFRAREESILACIAKARPDEETYVPGRVTVKFRIQRTGNVRGVRVEAPAILQKGGLTGCVKGVVGGIRFPPSSGSQIVSYPFSLT